MEKISPMVGGGDVELVEEARQGERAKGEICFRKDLHGKCN